MAFIINDALERVRIILTEHTADCIPENICEAFFELDEMYDSGALDDVYALEVKTILNSNEHLKDKDTLRAITNLDLASKGYWWWDPKNW